MLKKIAVAAGLAFLLLSGAVVSQSFNPPLVTVSHPFADLLQIVPNGQPVVGNVYTPWAGVTNVYGYYKSPTTIANGFNYQYGTNVSYAQLGNASAVSSGYIYLAAAPFDGARNCFFSIGGVTALTLYAGTTSQTLDNAVTAMTAATSYCYIYSLSNTTWDRD
jgi:hypothetical protein